MGEKIEIPALTDTDVAFGNCHDVLPKWEDIPEDFRRNWHRSSHEWCRIPSKLFHEGGSLAEFGPSHEHKIAGVGYLLSQWYDRAQGKG